MNLPDSIEWQAYEYLHVDRTPDWFWGVGLVTLVLAVIGILLNNLLFTVLVIIAAFTLTLQSLKHPKLETYALTKKGVIDGDVLYPYSTLESFWVDDEQFHPKLLIKSQKTFVPLIVLPLGDAEPEVVHNYLIQFIDVERHEEPFSQKLMEYLGF